MTRDSPVNRYAGLWRWIVTPLIAFIAFGAWALASPVGAAPDDDYHLASTWCANGGSDYCLPGSVADKRLIPETFDSLTCYVQHPRVSARCQTGAWEELHEEFTESRRGNFYGEYPPVYYAANRLAAGENIQASAVTMRLINAAIFVGLATALAALLPVARRRTVLWGWLIALVPLGMFLIPSNNPSGWAITGVGTAFLALLGWFETDGKRRWALGALYLVGVLMAAGARGDAAIYVAAATAVVLLLTFARNREWMMRAILPLGGLVVAFAFFLMADQAGVSATGFTSDGTTGVGSVGGQAVEPMGGFALAAFNLLMVPFLWTGVWGSWALGWLDTSLPAVVPAAAIAAFTVVAFAGLGLLNLRKAVAVGGLVAVLTVLPVYVLTAGGDVIPQNLQPRYLLPLIVLFSFVLVTEPRGRVLRFTRVQTFAILGALAIANLVALQVNIRRYVTGVDDQGVNLDAGAEWWWSGLAVGPTAVWVVGAIAYAGLLAMLWPSLRDQRVQPPVVAAAERSSNS